MKSGQNNKYVLFVFLIFLITTFAIPVHGDGYSDNITIVNEFNETIDKYAPEYRIPARGEEIPVEINEIENLENYSPEFNLANMEEGTVENGVQKGEADLIREGLIKFSDPKDRERALEMYSPEHNITAEYPPNNENPAIEVEPPDAPEFRDITARTFAGLFENFIDGIKFW